MEQEIAVIWEHRGEDTILWVQDYPGAFARGENFAEAAQKLSADLIDWSKWTGGAVPQVCGVRKVGEMISGLDVRDADSDALLESERRRLEWKEYVMLRDMAIRSAEAFEQLYHTVPDKDRSANPVRTTFYGQVPRTAREMYEHTKNVNAYYFGEIGVETDNEGSIADCRRRGFAVLERQPDFLENRVFAGSWDEDWTLRKVLRRFIWHDRLHARAMERMKIRTFGEK